MDNLITIPVTFTRNDIGVLSGESSALMLLMEAEMIISEQFITKLSASVH